jgi:hypothetical protein
VLEEFVVDNIKAMQWLALKVRFHLASPFPNFEGERETGKWKEFQKVGEVVGNGEVGPRRVRDGDVDWKPWYQRSLTSSRWYSSYPESLNKSLIPTDLLSTPG